MFTIAGESLETLERERERESKSTRNIATNVAAFVMPKENILKEKYEVSYV